MVVYMCAEGLWELRAANRRHLFSPGLGKMWSCVWRRVASGTASGSEEACCLSGESRRGRFLLAFILAPDLPACLPVTLCNLQLVWLFPLCYRPGAPRLCWRIAFVKVPGEQFPALG